MIRISGILPATTLALAVIGGTQTFQARAANLDCAGAATLDALATCISQQMPQSGSNGYHAPSVTVRSDFRAVYRQMLQGQCNFALPASLAGIMAMRTFTDAGNGRSYCLLMEILDADNNGKVDRGWGTFMVYAGATNETNHAAPHPIFDMTTENQAINIFRDSDARSYMMCGAHRNANGETGGTCDSAYGAADCAHQDDNFFHAAVIEMNNYYAATAWTHVQWHGNVSCDPIDAYGSQGFDAVEPANSNVRVLRGRMAINSPSVMPFDITGEGSSCTLNATSNVQGRYLNGATSVCSSNAGGTPGNKFAHIEQLASARNPALWIRSVQETWGGVPPPPPSPPAAPANLSATPGKRRIALAWSASSGATSYSVKRSLVNGGPYGAVATGITGTTYTNGGLTGGTTYYYVVTAVGPGGESGNSNQASATAR